VIKTPSKRATDVLRTLLDDFKTNSSPDENFHHYYDRQGKDYFYQLLKPLADLTTLKEEEFVDWGHEETFKTAIGVGECAGVVIDLVATLVFEAEEKLNWATRALERGAWADAIYHTYSVFISSAKAMLLDKGINSSTQIGTIKDFDTNYVESGDFPIDGTFADLVLKINKQEPSALFAQEYFNSASEFLKLIKTRREALLQS
jgi:sulfite reductase (ferredoxin)